MKYNVPQEQLVIVYAANYLVSPVPIRRRVVWLVPQNVSGPNNNEQIRPAEMIARADLPST